MWERYHFRIDKSEARSLIDFKTAKQIILDRNLLSEATACCILVTSRNKEDLHVLLNLRGGSIHFWRAWREIGIQKK